MLIRPLLSATRFLALSFGLLICLTALNSRGEWLQVAVSDTFFIFFDEHGATLDEHSIDVLRDVLTLFPHPQLRLEVVGFNDPFIQGEDSLAVSRTRAAAVAIWLIQNGVPRDRLIVHGRGASDPLVERPDGVADRRNCRVEVIIRCCP